MEKPGRDCLLSDKNAWQAIGHDLIGYYGFSLTLIYDSHKRNVMDELRDTVQYNKETFVFWGDCHVLPLNVDGNEIQCCGSVKVLQGFVASSEV